MGACYSLIISVKYHTKEKKWFASDNSLLGKFINLMLRFPKYLWITNDKNWKLLQ